jgi:hypothetical protein
MTDGLMLPPGAGRMIQGAGMKLKVGAGQSTAWSAFEAEVMPGFDVGAHLHHNAEELFYILEGELDQGGPPDPAAIAEVRARNDIQQLTPMLVARR